MKINSFDIDGVIYIPGFGGVYPGPDDVIITGRSIEEMAETEEMLWHKGIENIVYYNQLPFDEKTRISSGEHKAWTINLLRTQGTHIQIHFEDDPIQAKIIREQCPWVTVVELVHDLVEKENVRHNMYLLEEK